MRSWVSRSFALRVAISAALTTSVMGAAHAADDPGEANAFCKAAGQAIVENRLDDISALAVRGSGETVPAAKVDTVISQLREAEGDMGRFVTGPILVTTKDYGPALRKAWYLVTTAKGSSLFLYCLSVKVSDKWILDKFYFNSDVDKLYLQ